MEWMCRKIILNLMLLFIFSKSNADVLQIFSNDLITQKNSEVYQLCYDLLKLIVFNNYKRPITVLELGASNGCFSFSIAQDYDSTCVMVDNNYGDDKSADKLLKLCHFKSDLKNIILLNKKISLQEIEKLADCEHFDVVLAFDYIDQKDKQRQKLLNAILRLGDNIFVQSSRSKNNDGKKSCSYFNSYLASQGGNLILQILNVHDSNISNELFWFERKKDRLLCKCFVYKNNDKKNLFRIKSSYTQKVLTKKGTSTCIEWKKGINLVTFLMLNGVYPTKEKIKQAIRKHVGERLTDFLPKNLIIQGDDVVLIDQNDKYWRETDIPKCIAFIDKVIDQTSTAKVANCLQQKCVRHVRKRTQNWISYLLGV